MFCVGIHLEVPQLAAELRALGGGAWFDMDDGYALWVAANVVFVAIGRFAKCVREQLGLTVAFHKLACYSPASLLESCLERITLGAPMGERVSGEDGTGSYGIDVGGVPTLNEYATCYISCYTRNPCNAKWPHVGAFGALCRAIST
eukprot:3741838-Pleurochrysis_carterae.AAC.1